MRRRRRHVVDLRNLLMWWMRRRRIGTRRDLYPRHRRLRGIGRRRRRRLRTVLFHVCVRWLLRVLLLRVGRLLGMMGMLGMLEVLRMLLWMRWRRMLEPIGTGLLHHGRLGRVGRRVDGRRWHVGDSGMRTLMRARLRHAWGSRGHAANVIPRAGTGQITGLRGVASLLRVLSRVEDTVTDGR
jgi:hypothetical protein